MTDHQRRALEWGLEQFMKGGTPFLLSVPGDCPFCRDRLEGRLGASQLGGRFRLNFLAGSRVIILEVCFEARRGFWGGGSMIWASESSVNEALNPIHAFTPTHPLRLSLCEVPSFFAASKDSDLLDQLRQLLPWNVEGSDNEEVESSAAYATDEDEDEDDAAEEEEEEEEAEPEAMAGETPSAGGEMPESQQ